MQFLIQTVEARLYNGVERYHVVGRFVLGKDELGAMLEASKLQVVQCELQE